MINTIDFKEEIKYSDLVNYWMKFFPEVDSIDKFEDIIKQSFDKDLISMVEEWKANAETSNNKATVILKETYSNAIEDIFENFNSQDLQFFNFFQPIIKYYINKYYFDIQNLNNIDDHNLFICDIIQQIYKQLYAIAYKVLILEINISKEKNILKGNSSEERFIYFSNVLLKNVDFLIQLFKEYKELFSLLTYKAEHQVLYIIDIVNKTNSQLHKLHSKFENVKEGKLKTISTGMGDAHQGGKSVSFINFTSGKRLVYKPRSLEIEESYENLLNWINNKEIPFFKPLRSAKVHYAENSGWMEFIEYKECKNNEEVQDFYYRTGQLLCLLYALNSKDFHHENLIAQGSHPVLIDLESLIHVDIRNEDEVKTDAISSVDRMILSSVYTIYLLPSRIITSGQADAQVLDIGGLGGEKEQKSPFKTSVIQHNNTDQIRVGKDYTIIPPENNNPKVNGVVHESQYYIDYIEDGFTHLYRWINENKQNFINKITDLFSKIECRAILKPTFLYSRLLHTSFHPDVLRNPVDRQILLGRIAMASSNNDLDKVTSSEVKDLLRGDIPYFTAYSNLRQVENSENKTVQNFHLKSSALEDIKNKVSEFSYQDLEKQLSFIDLSFAHNAQSEKQDTTGTIFPSAVDSTETLTKNEQLNIAIKIGERLLSKSIEGNEEGSTDRTWLGLMIMGKNEITTSISSVGLDLYRGNSGIGMYFAYLASITGEERFKTAAIESIRPVVRLLEGLNNEEIDERIHLNIGGFTGISGMMYALFYIGKTLKREDLTDLVYDNINVLLDNLKATSNYELISGSAGCLGVVISLYQNTIDIEKKKQLLKLANKIYLQLKDNCTYHSNNSIFWGPLEETEGYTGFAHGTSGISANLMRLYSITNDTDILNLVERSLNFERSMLNEEGTNWYTNLSKKVGSSAWCHGAAGILLNRILLKQFGYQDEFLDNEIKIALDTTLKGGFGNGISLCHGDLGNLSIVEHTARILNDQDLEDKCNSTYVRIFKDYISQNWDKGIFRSFEIYGLMVGSAGEGYSILRKITNYELPNILWLE
ncbi:type 2 lanthipeptide synthetase LanM family protein [Priestia megaterium]|uniref:type 2 lanthipeptide synthetase LanM family protein n=1 Tax=Priestia megaterium TaxID=1404 RepID=UPI00077D887A|nr:type 2 lanthipeptide synthetase LanM family protein [Priestia megaterium]